MCANVTLVYHVYQGASVTGTLGNLTSIRLCLLCIRWMDRFTLCGVKGQPNSFTQFLVFGGGGSPTVGKLREGMCGCTNIKGLVRVGRLGLL